MSGALRPGVWFAATRPAFLSVTLLAVGLGFVLGWWRGAPLAASALPVLLLALLGALLAHAGANVLNDVADHDNGSDACNVDRVAPFTGGSRFIQDGRLSRTQMAGWASWLFAGCAACGLALLALLGLGALPLGVAATRQIARHAATPARLEGAIRLTLLQAHLVGALLILGLIADRTFRN